MKLSNKNNRDKSYNGRKGHPQQLKTRRSLKIWRVTMSVPFNLEAKIGINNKFYNPTQESLSQTWLKL